MANKFLPEVDARQFTALIGTLSHEGEHGGNLLFHPNFAILRSKLIALYAAPNKIADIVYAPEKDTSGTIFLRLNKDIMGHFAMAHANLYNVDYRKSLVRNEGKSELTILNLTFSLAYFC